MDIEQSPGPFGTFASASALDKNKSSCSASITGDRSVQHGDSDLLGGEKVDQVLAAKMILVNDVSGQNCQSTGESTT